MLLGQILLIEYTLSLNQLLSWATGIPAVGRCPRKSPSVLLGYRANLMINMDDPPSLLIPSHAPAEYRCPFCQIVQEGMDRQGVVVESRHSVAVVSLHQPVERPGSVLVMPNLHFENLYVLPDDYCADLWKLVRNIARAQKQSLQCDGVTVRQHNEPSGGQDVWHLHVHVIPRFRGVSGSMAKWRPLPLADRAKLAATIALGLP